MSRIFISYSRKDVLFARQLATSLSDLGADVWIDVEDIPAGMKWSTAIQQGLRQCQAMVVVVSPDSIVSNNVEDEWQDFLDNRKPVIPVLIRPVPSADMHFQLRRIQYIDFHQQNYEAAFAQLHAELGRNGAALSPLGSIPSELSEPDVAPGKLFRLSGRRRAILRLLGLGLLLMVVLLTLNRVISSLQTPEPTTNDYYGDDFLQLSGAIHLSKEVIFLVNAPPGHRYYWRSRAFDTYDLGRWTQRPEFRITSDQSPSNIVYDPDDLIARESVQQRFTMILNASRLVYAASQPIVVDLPTKTDLKYVPNDETRTAMNVSVIRPVGFINQGDSYTVTSLLSNATADQLRAVPAIYPDWVVKLDLRVPPEVTDRVSDLAKAIVEAAHADTPYDRAKAIEFWLRTNIFYNETIPDPPKVGDPVEWVLFDSKQGYCSYYASAMVIMLRTQGIPARLVAGFAQGTYDTGHQAYSVLERDAHTWVEVYFPGYGWIEFEPTSVQSPLAR